MDDRELFEGSQDIHLTKDEEQMLKSQLMTFMKENPVRVEAAECLPEQMDKATTTLIAAAQKIRMTREEDTAMGKNLAAFIKKNPAGDILFEEKQSFFSSFRLVSFRFAPALACAFVLVAAGGGVSYAAESALPGDFLYPIKVHVNEEVKARLIADNESRAQFEALRLERRVQEAENLANSQKLTEDARADVRAAIAEQIVKTQKHLEQLAEAGNANAAADISVQIEGNMNGHKEVLRAFASANSGAVALFTDILNDVEDATTAVVKARSSAEATVTAGDETSVRTAAEKSINTLNETFKLRLQAQSGTSSSASDDARFNTAREALKKAQDKLNEKDFTNAFKLSREAQRLTEQAKTIQRAEQKLNVNIHTSNTASSTPSHNTTTESSVKVDVNDTTNTEVKVESTTNTNVHVETHIGL